MNLHILNFDQSKIGGGWTAGRYLSEGLGNVAYEEADVVLIAGPTMVDPQQVEQAKRDGKKIVLRLDNHLLPSRNSRSTGMPRMKIFADLADLIIYQSHWAKSYLMPFTKKDGVVILNGVDTELFKPRNKLEGSCIYIRSSRINEKGWEMARHWYTTNYQIKSLCGLTIVGKFSPDNLESGFDFYNGEVYAFMGEQPRENVASLMAEKQYFLYSYFMDACSNTLLEARASGCEIVDCYGMLKTGGAPEIMELEDLSVERMVAEYSKEMERL